MGNNMYKFNTNVGWYYSLSCRSLTRTVTLTNREAKKKETYIAVCQSIRLSQNVVCFFRDGLWEGGCIIALDTGTAMSPSLPLASRVGCKSKLLCKSAETDIFLREVLTDCPCGGDAKIPQNGIALNGFKR